MYRREVVIKNETGLHARPAAYFVKEASGFQAAIWVGKSGQRVDAKSIISVMSLGVARGDMVEISAEGADATEAVEALCRLVETGFPAD
ncbi:MAG: HPr family phosphocarrier protein [Firmicutes bacterium]|nr:HPr family phosphocarrier protein [Bacillota bacterium]